MRIYISIPISGHHVETQQRKALDIAERLRALGHEPVNPFDTPPPTEELDEKSRYAYYMGEDLKRLLTCDAILMCNGWTKSRGCRIEQQIAYIMRLEEYYDIEDIPNNK